MFLLGHYIPEQPALVESLAHFAEAAQEAHASDALRAVEASRSNLERLADDVIKGLEKLRNDAQSLRMDLEALLYEIQTEERKALRNSKGSEKDLREAESLIFQARRVGMPQERVAEIMAFREQTKVVRDVQGRVWRAYHDTRLELEKLRAARLAQYVHEWEAFLASIEGELSQNARKAWNTAQKLKLWAPEGSLTDTGSLLMVWDRGPHHVQVEVYASSSFDWFYRHREKEGYQFGEDLPIGDLHGSLLPLSKMVRKG